MGSLPSEPPEEVLTMLPPPGHIGQIIGVPPGHWDDFLPVNVPGLSGLINHV